MKPTYDCEPTMTDTQVLDFCRKGFLMLEAVVPDEVNKRACDYCELYASGGPFKEDSARLPDEIFELDWFADNVILNSGAIGVVRSLLGKNFQLPTFMANHSVVCPGGTGEWHRDAGSLYGPKIDSLKVFYYPQDVTPEMGPTEILLGSHLAPTGQGIEWRGGRLMDSSAGTVFITMYSILHRKSESTAEGMRNMLKWSYWRTVPPQRDWIIEPDFDLHTANYGGHGTAKLVARKLYWLCGKADEFRTMGGQSWPYSGSQASQIHKSYGFPSGPPQW